MKYNKLASWFVTGAVSLVVISGCASNGPAESSSADGRQTTPNAPQAGPPASPALPGTTHQDYDELPAYRLDGAGFYRLLVSELALLNEAPDVALFLLGEAHDQYPREPRILARLAPLAAQLGELDMALKYFQRWAETAPRNSDAWHGVWQLAFIDRDIDIAVAALESLLEHSPGYGIYVPFSLLLEWEDHELRTFYDRIESSELNTEQSSDIQLMQGYIAELLSQPELAAGHWRTLTNTVTGSEQYFSVGQLLTDLEASTGARILLTDATEEHPTESRFYLLLARAHLQSNEDASALDTLQNGLERNPDDTGLLRFAGELAFEQEDYTAARGYFERLQGTPEADAGYYYLGRLAEQDEAYDTAFEYYQNVTGDEWVLSATQRMLPLLQHPALDDVDQDAFLDHQLQRFPALQAELSELHGLHHYDNGDYEQAFDAFSNGLRRDPNNFSLLYMRALSAEPLDRLDELESDLRQILQRDPDNTAALNALGYTLVDRTDRIEEAAPLIERAYEQSPNNYAITDSLGWLRFHQGEYQQAVDLLRKALDLQGWDVNDDEVVSHYVEALWMNDQQDEALSVARRWLDQHSNNARLQRVLARLQETN